MWIKTNNRARRIPLLLGLFAFLTLAPTTVHANEVQEVTEEELLLLAEGMEPAVFSVTVPTSLPLYVNEYGVVSTASNATITNNSNSSVQVVDMNIVSTSEYDIKSYDEDFDSKYMNTYELALNINGSKTRDDGSLSFDMSGFPAIQSGSTQRLDYEAKVTSTSERLNNAHVADVYITIDWSNFFSVRYDARGGLFDDGNNINVITYTENGKIISGALKEPTKPNAEFAGWYTDETFTTEVTDGIATEATTLYARWRVPYTVQHSLQSLDNSYEYIIQETEYLMGLEGETVWPETKTYDKYDAPPAQSLTISGNGDSVLTYIYERTSFWLDVNFIIDGKETGGPGDGDAWPSELTQNFVYVYVNGQLVGGGRDYCHTHPVGSYYSVEVNLPENYYYVGTYEEGYDEWNDGTKLYRHPASGYLTENVGIRLIINTISPNEFCYYISFDANGGEGEMPPMTMVFGDDFTESEQLDWCSFTKEGHWFNGWSLSPDARNPDFTDCQTVSGLSNTNGETVTLYAIWMPYEWYGLRAPEEAPAEEESSPEEDVTETENSEVEEDEQVEDSIQETPEDTENTPSVEEENVDETPKEPSADEENNNPLPEDADSSVDDDFDELTQEPPAEENSDEPVVEGPDDVENNPEQPPVDNPEISDNSKDDTIDSSEESKEETEEDKNTIEPVYYCGMDVHVHAEDCENAETCELKEHKHTSECLVEKSDSTEETEDISGEETENIPELKQEDVVEDVIPEENIFQENVVPEETTTEDTPIDEPSSPVVEPPPNEEALLPKEEETEPEEPSQNPETPPDIPEETNEISSEPEEVVPPET